MGYKEQLLGNERMTLAALHGEMERTAAMLEAITGEKAKCDTELAQKQGDGELTPLAYQLYYRYDSFLKEEILRIKKSMAQLAARIEKQVEVIKNIKLETKSLETVRKSKLANYKKEELHNAELLMDEFVNTAKIMSRVNA
jgi:flagellar export protein FliJ